MPVYVKEMETRQGCPRCLQKLRLVEHYYLNPDPDEDDSGMSGKEQCMQCSCGFSRNVEQSDFEEWTLDDHHRWDIIPHRDITANKNAH